MMEKISQRTKDDCTICVLAMVMGPPYSYERILEDSKKYPKTDDEGHGLAWWKDYLKDEGFEVAARRRHARIGRQRRVSHLGEMVAARPRRRSNIRRWRKDLRRRELRGSHHHAEGWQGVRSLVRRQDSSAGENGRKTGSADRYDHDVGLSAGRQRHGALQQFRRRGPRGKK